MNGKAFSFNEKQNINSLMNTIQEYVGMHTNPDTAHYEICSQVCDEFGLWEYKEKPANLEVGMEPLEESIPIWVCYLVSGAMKDIGVASNYDDME